MRYDAVLFDNDGVLTTLTDWDAIRSAIDSTFEEFGITHPTDDHREAVLRGDVDGLVSICTEHGIDADEFWYARDRNASTVQQTEILAGRKDLYDDVASIWDLPSTLGVVSNNQHETIEFILDHFDIHERFSTYYGREPTLDGIRRKKPRAYYLERALSDLGTRDALYVGDSEVDVAAADRADVDSAFVRRSHRTEYTLDREPTFEIGSLEELSSIVSPGSSTGRTLRAE